MSLSDDDKRKVGTAEKSHNQSTDRSDQQMVSKIEGRRGKNGTGISCRGNGDVDENEAMATHYAACKHISIRPSRH